jgi:hypothetical protein
MAKASTKATEKYQKEAGLAAKTYKLKAEDAEAFKAACEENGESQAAALTRMMKAYVDGGEETKSCWLCRLIKKIKQKKGAVQARALMSIIARKK